MRLPSLPARSFSTRNLRFQNVSKWVLRFQNVLPQAAAKAASESEARELRAVQKVPAPPPRFTLHAVHSTLYIQSDPPPYHLDTPRPSPRTNRTRRVPHPVLRSPPPPARSSLRFLLRALHTELDTSSAQNTSLALHFLCFLLNNVLKSILRHYYFLKQAPPQPIPAPLPPALPTVAGTGRGNRGGGGGTSLPRCLP